MSGELGFAQNFRERIYEPLQRYRGSDGTPGREIRLEEFVQTRARNNEGGYGLRNTLGDPLTLEDIFQDLALDPALITLDNLVSLSGDVRYLAPEIVRQFIVEGLESNANHLDLVNSSQNVGSLTVTSPWIQYHETRPQDIGEAETIPVSRVTWDSKTIQLKKSAVAIEVTDEVILSTPLNILGEYLSEVGIELAIKLFRAGVSTLINGDQAGGADNASIVGVGTAGSLAFGDFVRVWTRASRIGNRWVNMLSNETLTNVILGIDEFKNPQGAGSVKVNVDSNRVIPSSMMHRVADQFTDDQLMLFDRRAMDYLVFRALLVENERIMMRQINGTAASIISGFTTLKRIRRIIIDRSLAFAANGFPAYMTPREAA